MAKVDPATNVVADVSKSERPEDGSVGWRLSTSEGNTPNRSADVSYRAPVARVEAGVQQYGNDFRATAEVDGAIALAGGSVFATNRIDDAFAVVDAGVPGVAVQYQNRPIGRTNSRGLILIPGLKSYEPNTVSIDPSNLPVDADVPSTKDIVVPADRSGVVIRFGVSNKPKAALVSFIDKGGAPLEAGVSGRLENSLETFVVGYDGEAYIHGLERQNAIVIERADGSTCAAQFAYDPAPGQQVQIGNVVCQ
ncbi:fimbria/pilus outer membrane usher protein [Mesorhizobium sp. AR07]|uniref:fimbria/pilus outer membrane usher protein n=1 Tax=Mesorhizobium sp. AR07 TaxID=2865838 RepID=UPI0029E8093B|nr:fimbria/pilus outer membrane usher protein [Mesorhizobium sp. AR07]